MPHLIRLSAVALAAAAVLSSSRVQAADETPAPPLAGAPRPAPIAASALPPVAPAPGQIETPEETTARLNATIKARIEAAEARDRARDAAYAADVAAYEARKKADAADYARAQADYEAQKAAVAAQREAELGAWKARVAACKAGDKTQCAQR